MYFIIRGKGTYSHDYKRKEDQRREKERKSVTVPFEADPNCKAIRKIGEEVIAMKRSGETRERMDRELGSEVIKITTKKPNLKLED